MYNKTKLFTNDKSHNLIIINKEGMDEEENKKKRKSNTIKFGTIITLKGEDFALKMNLLNTKDINREKILKTVTSMKKQLIDSDSESTIKDNDYTKNRRNFLYLNNIINHNKNTSNIKRDISEGSVKESNKPNICKTNNEIDKYTDYEGQNKLLINGLKSSLNEEENNQNNNISIYEFNKNENIKIKESSIIYNESNYCKVINNQNVKENSFIYDNNKKKIDNNTGNRIKFKNNFINIYQNHNNNNDISNSIKTNINNIYNENINDNMSENKKLIIIKKAKKFKNPSILEQNNNIEIHNNKQKNNNKPSKFSNKNNLIENNNNPQIFINENRKMRCFICEKIFKMNKIFVPKCLIHYICIKCIKSYYEEKFENNNFSLKCPDANCNQEFDFNILKDIISLNHCEMFLNNPQEDKNNNININNYNNNNTKEMFLKDSKILFNSKMNNENIKIYSQKHVLDINSNEKLFMYKKNKDIYCYKCLKPTLFTKINGYFIKCLNCHYRICKYCLKEFNEFHMDLLSKDHCKVYYRKEDFLDYYLQKKKKIILYLIQLFYVIAMYYLMFAGVYFLVFTFLKKPIKFNFLRLLYYFFISLISFLILIICSPFLIIIFPFFPIIISIADY